MRSLDRLLAHIPLPERPHRHDVPHIATGFDGLGLVCLCSCDRCDVTITKPNGEKVTLCVCPRCDAWACGLHLSTPVSLVKQLG